MKFHDVPSHCKFQMPTPEQTCSFFVEIGTMTLVPSKWWFSKVISSQYPDLSVFDVKLVSSICSVLHFQILLPPPQDISLAKGVEVVISMFSFSSHCCENRFGGVVNHLLFWVTRVYVLFWEGFSTLPFRGLQLIFKPHMRFW